MKLKEIGTAHWNSTNIADNSSGFTALPGGLRSFDGSGFFYIGRYGHWWSSNETGWAALARYTYLQNISPNVTRDVADFKMGCSVRCIKD
jgi:uncharacterized protein (TIGR02145 family)